LNGTAAANNAMSTFQTDPGYGFDLSQGLRAIDAGAASKGILSSGATIKAEQQFGTGLADQSFSNYYNRLAGLSTLGESAANSDATAATGQANVATGAAGAQSGIAANTTNGIGSSVSGLFNNPAIQSGINSLFSPAAVGSSSAGSVPSGDFSEGF
jgi:hypothetical protein